MKEKLDRVKYLIREGSRIEIEILCNAYLIGTNHKELYGVDELGHLRIVEQSVSRYEQLEELKERYTDEIYDILVSLDKDFEKNIMKSGGILEYLEDRYSVTVEKVSAEEQKSLTGFLLGKEYTLNELLDVLEGELDL